YKSVYDKTYQNIKRLNQCAPGDPSPQCVGYSSYGIAGTLAKLRSLMRSGPSGLSATGVVFGYPYVAPSGDGAEGYARQHCAAMVASNLDPCEQTFIRDGIDQLNKILQREALNQGFHFLDLRQTFAGHNLCEADGDWIQQPFIPTNLDGVHSLMHPKREGHTAIARAIEGLLRSGAATDSRTPAGMPRIRKRRGGDFGGWVESIWHVVTATGNLNWCENSSQTGSSAQSGGGKGFGGKALTRQGIHDGYSDILWRNSSTGDNAIWYMEGTTAVGSATLSNVGDTGNWHIAGTADFNRDGQEDIFWRHTASGTNVVWFMRGTTFIGSASIANVNSGWRVGAVADFNGDDQPDIVWRHSSGANVIWVMNGTTAVSSATLTSIADANWQILGAGDFNSDGSPDLLWRNPTTTSMSIWLMDGTASKSGIAFPTDITPDATWAFGAIMDVDGDDQLDLVWRNNYSGDVAAMYLKQTEYKGFSQLFTLADGNWQIAGPR
ncbi:MAG: FG-GAP-like repeat-containing protein, partial [Lysobacterales bacterium]